LPLLAIPFYSNNEKLVLWAMSVVETPKGINTVTERIPCYTSTVSEAETWPVPKEVDVSASVAEEIIL
jgi:hypothetical protein